MGLDSTYFIHFSFVFLIFYIKDQIMVIVKSESSLLPSSQPYYYHSWWQWERLRRGWWPLKRRWTERLFSSCCYIAVERLQTMTEWVPASWFFFSCHCSPWNHCRCWSHRAWWCSEGSKWTPSGSVAPWIWRPGRRSGRGDCPRSHVWWSSGP